MAARPFLTDLSCSVTIAPSDSRAKCPAIRIESIIAMPVKLTFRDKEFTIEEGCTARHAIEQCGLSPEATLAVKGGQLISDNSLLQDGDEIKLVAVISGG